ncbi:MAG TPA: SDR family NAD(P)-dependent oxidoreductase [Spirochaetota bacterium]|nr:SDR family NAD(P)-dependent oxidoreductase [Spirochaetota bacterium]HOD13813.1 SDR family NAD(P)-dependent oxidoreductase [Spirochaetota bacterium]HPG50150.1 SDR family NAD(P)-dependent oxidoreductase [Spirochaetota bacterium]HPN11571.1 SDR family NAD(P)-dependent oxidoreductase [Spirochaetota bacterium]HQL81231.1 SDR family NAD(P)-dependent oxidoreductase [Spirochaetota bacterium]
MGQVVVITGCADGMGRHVATMLAGEGYSVAGFDVDAKGVKSLEKELKQIGGDHLVEVLDITDRPGIKKFSNRVLEKYGHVDTVLSNVGIGFFSPFEEANLEKALKCLDINIIGAAAIFQAFIPSMRERRSGKLIAMSSLVGRIPFPFESIYSASKFAITGMVLSLKYEVEPFGIQVALIEPAQVSTSFAAKIHVLPPEGSVYRDRARRFIERDDELIKTAPNPVDAAKKIVSVIEAKKPSIFNQIDFMSSFFLWLNQFLPRSLRDAILVNHMHIKV